MSNADNESAVITIFHIFTNKSNNRFSQCLWVFPVWGGLATCPGCVQGGCGSEQKMKWKPDNSLSTEEDIAAFIVDLLQNHLIPGTVAGKSRQKSQYCK